MRIRVDEVLLTHGGYHVKFTIIEDNMIVYHSSIFCCTRNQIPSRLCGELQRYNYIKKGEVDADHLVGKTFTEEELRRLI